MTTFPINYSFEEIDIKGVILSTHNGTVKLIPNDIDEFLRIVDNVKNKILYHKYKYNSLGSISKKSLNQLFKYPLKRINLKEYIVIHTDSTDIDDLEVNVEYNIKIIPNYIMVHGDTSWKLMFTITKIVRQNNYYLFIDKEETKPIKETQINAYL